MIRFRNEMFKVYCRIRPSLFVNVDRRVAEAWDSVTLLDD